MTRSVPFLVVVDSTSEQIALK